jgi:hypothetical protein
MGQTYGRAIAAGGTLTLEHTAKIHGYAIQTDGTNLGTLKIFQNTASGTQLWEDQVSGADRARAHDFGEPLVAPAGSTALVVTMTGTGATAYVRVS